jgi:DNA polymerase-3 subunit alpha
MTNTNVFINLHQHTDYSNGSMFEVVSTTQDYIDYAKEHQLPAVCITNHGNVVGWLKSKRAIEKAGLKYIHGMEAYVTMTLDEKIKDSYHTILIAKNYEGVKEINRLSSGAFNRDDNHYYFKPRILFDDLVKTSDNVIVTTACLGGAIWQSISHNQPDVLTKWLEFAQANPDRVYLEVQPHMDDDQKALNKALLEIAKTSSLKLIASNDVHAATQEHNTIRQIIKKGKGIEYEGDDAFELWSKDYDEMYAGFKAQGVLSDEQINDALTQTAKIVQQVEEFEVDRTAKYPHVSDNPDQELLDSIQKGYHEHGLDQLPIDDQQVYLQRIQHEVETFRHNGAVEYMVLDNMVAQEAHRQGRQFGYGRGSAAGSLVMFLTGETAVDPIKWGLSFERFMNPERVSLADVDRDFESVDQQAMQRWLVHNPSFHSAAIMTINTFGLKSAIPALANGMPEYAGKKSVIESIKSSIADDGSYAPKLRAQNEKLFQYAEAIMGVTSSFGRHAAGILVSSDQIDETVGTMTLKTSTSPDVYLTTQLDMGDIEYMKYVKMDILGLDNVGLIKKACDYADLPYLTPESTDIIDPEDEAVWNSLTESTIGIFQFEGERAENFLQKLFSKETMAKIKAGDPDIKMMDMLSLANAAMRPAGASYIESLTRGEFYDNGHPALNKFLGKTMGRLVYQESLIEFLEKFCGYTAGKADIIRRGIGHKIPAVMNEEVPKIKPAFVKTMVEKYGDTKEHAESIADAFIQVFMDAANYGFSVNHSTPYSWIGYISAWLRYYYPIEFITAGLEIWKDKPEKTNKLIQYAQSKGITIQTPKFRKSKGAYFFDKEANVIYQGTSPIKENNAQTGDTLYELKDDKFNTFTDFLLKITDNGVVTDHGVGYESFESTFNRYQDNEDAIKDLDKMIKAQDMFVESNPMSINKSQMEGLISIDYFAEFGKRDKLMKIYTYFRDNYKKTAKTMKTKFKKYWMIRDFESSCADEDFSYNRTVQAELYYFGAPVSVDKTVPTNYAFIVGVEVKSYRVKAALYIPSTGDTVNVLMRARLYRDVPFGVGDLINIKSLASKPRNVNVDGEWVASKTESDVWLEHLEIIKKKEGKK